MKTTALNPLDATANAVFSAYDRAIASPASPTSYRYAVRSVAPILTGEKKFFSILVNTYSSDCYIGFGAAATDLAGGSAYPGQDAVSLGMRSNSGAVFVNGAGVTSIFSYGASDVIDIAVNRVNGKYWMRKNGGNWNNSGSANPATNTGGLTFSLGADPMYPMVAVNTTSGGAVSKMTINFGTSAYTHAKPSGYSDIGPGTDADYITSLIAAAYADRSYEVVLPVQRFDMTEQVIVLLGCKLIGSGRAKHSYPNTDLPDGESTVLDINWGNGSGYAGDNTKAAILLQSSSGVYNIAFNYPGQNPANNPVEWGATIAPSNNALAWDQEVRDCFFQKSYIAIDFRGSECGPQAIGSCTIMDNRGSPLHTGIWVDYLTDWSIIERNWWNSGWINPFANPVGNMRTWVSANGAGVRLGGNDVPTIDRLQVFGYGYGVVITPGSGYAGAGPFRVVNSNFDATVIGVLLEPTDYYHHTTFILGCNFGPADANPPGGPSTQGYALVATDCEGVGIVYDHNYSYSSTAGVIYAPGAVIGLFTVVNSQATNGTGAAALNIGGGSTVYAAGNHFVGFV